MKLRGWVVVNTNNMDDKVILKDVARSSANIIDDYVM